jgi:drug/metabolite transporter (DMT)-like permease
VPARKYFVLAAIVLFGASGDVSLSRGMKAAGNISLSNWTHIFGVLLSPWVLAGIVLLIAFMACYLTALSWADLTFVLPATAVGYILMALLARFFLHEQVSLRRWIGIVLITIGVGFVTGGPTLTEHEKAPEPEATVAKGRGQ